MQILDSISIINHYTVSKCFPMSATRLHTQGWIVSAKETTNDILIFIEILFMVLASFQLVIILI